MIKPYFLRQEGVMKCAIYINNIGCAASKLLYAVSLSVDRGVI